MKQTPQRQDGCIPASVLATELASESSQAKLLVEEDSQTEIPNMFGHPQLHGFPSIFMDFPLKAMELEGIFIRPPIFCPWTQPFTAERWAVEEMMRFSLGDQVFWARRTLDHEFWIINTDIKRQQFWFIWGSNTPQEELTMAETIIFVTTFMNHRFVYLATSVIGSPFKDDCDESRVTNTILSRCSTLTHFLFLCA